VIAPADALLDALFAAWCADIDSVPLPDITVPEGPER
jgi:hypothetical protein